jgi:ketol-acid reductoisomerase
MSFSNSLFEIETIALPGGRESIVRGGRHLFGKLGQAFAGIHQIGIIGWGSQAPARSRFRLLKRQDSAKLTALWARCLP